MSDQPSNAASEAARRFVALLTDSASPPGEVVRALVTDDFMYEDRRRGPSFPPADAATFPKVLDTYWETGAGQPRFEHEIFAVRGERFAAGILRVDYGNGMQRESIIVMALDPALRLAQRMVDFDTDEIDGAITELDRLHARAAAS